MAGYKWGMGDNSRINMNLIRALQADDERRQQMTIHQDNLGARTREADQRDLSRQETIRHNQLTEQNQIQLRRIAEARAKIAEANKDRIAAREDSIAAHTLRRQYEQSEAFKQLKNVNPYRRDASERLNEIRDQYPNAFESIKGDNQTDFQSHFNEVEKEAQTVRQKILDKEAATGVPMVYIEEGPLTRDKAVSGRKPGEPDFSSHSKLVEQKRLEEFNQKSDAAMKQRASDITSELKSAYGMTPGQFLNPAKKDRGNFQDKDGKLQFVPSEEGSSFQIYDGDKFQTMSRAEHDRFMNALQPAPVTPTTVGPAVTQNVATPTQPLNVGGIQIAGPSAVPNTSASVVPVQTGGVATPARPVFKFQYKEDRLVPADNPGL